MFLFNFLTCKICMYSKNKDHVINFTCICLCLQDDHRGFRRQLEDKRPVVENSLLSGRQYIANEPPLSDTSDSEGIYIQLQRTLIHSVHCNKDDLFNRKRIDRMYTYQTSYVWACTPVYFGAR